MLTQEQLAAYFEHQLPPVERADFERMLADDQTAQWFLADQENIDLALRVLLGKAEAHDRVKESIFIVLRGASVEQLTAHVMEQTRAGQAAEVLPLVGKGVKWIKRWVGGDQSDGVMESPAPAWSQWLGEFQARWRQRWALSAVIALALLGCGLFLLFRPAPATGILVGQFAAVIGQPTLRRESGRAAIEAQANALVHLGDRIETGDADRAEIQFNDGTTLRLGFSTTLEISNSKFKIQNSQLPPLRPPEITLLRGQIWTKVAKLTNSPQYAIRTVAATAVARGTEFGVKIQRAASTNSSAPTTVLTVKEGAVDFSNALGSVQATAMTESSATADRAPTQPVPLRIIKTFDLAAGKQLNVEMMTPVFEQDSWMYKMVYPQGWAGFYVRAIRDSGDDTVRRLQVVRVWPGSPADRAGLAVGDVITRVDGQSVTNIHEVLRPVFRRQGSAVTVDVLRGELARTASFVTTNHPYALPYDEMSTDLAANALDATWSLIEAGCQEVVSSNQWLHLAQEFQTVLARYPNTAALHNNLAVWYEMKEEIGTAIQHLKQAISVEPNNPLYHYNLSRVLASIGNFERCVEEAQKVVQLAPAWVPGLVDVAHAYSLLARYDDALAAIEHGLGANPAHPKLWNTKGFLLLTSRRPEEALNAVLKAVELEPSNAQWWAFLDTVYWALGDLAKAEAASRKTIELDPNYAEAYHSLAINIISRFENRLPGDVTDASPEELAIERWRERPTDELAIIAEAERYGRRAVELRRNFAGAYKDLGQILLMRGAVADAEVIMRTAMEIDPGGQAAANACNGLAYHFAIWGIRLDEALQLARQAVDILPAGYIVDTLAAVHFRRGDWDQAEAAWKKCLQLAGPAGDPGAWFHLGKVYERKNQTASSIEAYQEALRLRPDFPEATRALAKLPK